MLPVVPGKYRARDSEGFAWEMTVVLVKGELDYFCESVERGSTVAGLQFAACECCGVVAALDKYRILKWYLVE